MMQRMSVLRGETPYGKMDHLTTDLIDGFEKQDQFPRMKQKLRLLN